MAADRIFRLHHFSSCGWQMRSDTKEKGKLWKEKGKLWKERGKLWKGKGKLWKEKGKSDQIQKKMESFLGNFSPGFCARCFLVKYKKSERTLIITIKYILLYEFEWYLFKIHFLHLKVGSEFLCGWQLANKEWETSGRVWLSSDHVWVRSGLPQNIPKISHNCLNLSLNYPSWQHDRLIILIKHFIFTYLL